MKEINSASATSIFGALSTIASSAAAIIGNYGDSDYLITKNEEIPSKVNAMFNSQRRYHIQDVKDMDYSQRQFIADCRKYTLPHTPMDFTSLIGELLEYSLEYESQQRKLTELKTRLQSARDEIEQKANALSEMEEHRDSYKHEANELTAELKREQAEHQQLKAAYAQLQKNYADIAPTSDAQFGHHPGGSTSLDDLKI